MTTLLIPGDALVNGTEGTRVATAGVDGKVHFKNVRVGNDFGNEVEVVTGLNGDEQVIVNPPDSLVDGEQVQIVHPDAQAQGQPAPASQKPAGK